LVSTRTTWRLRKAHLSCTLRRVRGVGFFALGAHWLCLRPCFSCLIATASFPSGRKGEQRRGHQTRAVWRKSLCGRILDLPPKFDPAVHGHFVVWENYPCRPR
jgi:hypothetical protein